MDTKPWVLPFLEHIAAGATQAEAARLVGVSTSSVYALRKRDDDFDAAFDRAQEDAYDMMEGEARRRAFDGVNEPVIYQGQMMTTEDPDTGERVPLTTKRYSDSLVKFLLAGYRKRFATSRTEHTGADGGPVVVDDTERHARISALMAQAAARREQDPEGLT